MGRQRDMDRRRFLKAGLGGAAGLGLAGLGLHGGASPSPAVGDGRSAGARDLPAPRTSAGRWDGAQERYPVAAEEPWGRLLRIADGVWALESAPMVDRTTLCNGGIIRGRAGVVVVEAFGTDEGARWMAAQAERLTGRPPTHVVLTHHHRDHVAGLRGAAETSGVEILATARTLEAAPGRPDDPDGPLDASVRTVGDGRPTEVDLGDRSLVLVPRSGHTASDLTVEVFEPSVVFAGDLVWNGMFPNYVDAIPSRLTRSVRLLQARGADVFVTGHGAMADGRALSRYLDLLDDVEAAARTALEEGRSAEEAGARYRLPAGMEDWTLFDPGYFARAIGAWVRELAG